MQYCTNERTNERTDGCRENRRVMYLGGFADFLVALFVLIVVDITVVTQRLDVGDFV